MYAGAVYACGALQYGVSDAAHVYVDAYVLVALWLAAEVVNINAEGFDIKT